LRPHDRAFPPIHVLQQISARTGNRLCTAGWGSSSNGVESGNKYFGSCRA
jgi:hypothetical protein